MEEKINWKLPIYIEQEVQRIITQQEINGWLFDSDLANRHIVELEKRRNNIYKEVRPLLRREVIRKWKEVSNPFTKSGEVISRVATHIDPDLVGGPLNIVDFEEPDLGKRTKLMDQLRHHGWKPLEYTDKGSPKLTEESLSCFSGGVGKRITEWYIYSHRQSQIEGWLRRVRDDGRIEAQANTCGTNTGRMRHKIVVNVPKAKPSVLFGREMRSLFTVPEGKVLIGHDASGLEARMLAHFMNDEDLTNEIIHGDFHTKVWNTIKDWIISRDNAKNIEYALIYGASDRKLGSMADKRDRGDSDEEVGALIRSSVMAGLPSLGALSEEIKERAKAGYLIGLDGRRLPVRSPHSALNLLFQNAGAVVMKMSMILLDKWLSEEGYTTNEVKKVGDFHDEGQAEVEDNDEIKSKYKELSVKSIVQSGEFFNLNCPLDAEAIEGKTWAETH